jgi:hypothetical protein
MCNFLQVGIAKAAEVLETARFHSEACQDRVLAATKNVALAERLSIASGEGVFTLAALVKQESIFASSSARGTR